jgi:inositol transport system ATP-binding protein
LAFWERTARARARSSRSCLGAQPASEGTITFAGASYAPTRAGGGSGAGIVTIYQELSLIPTLSVAENIFLGRAPMNRLGLVDWRRMRRESRASSRG